MCETSNVLCDTSNFLREHDYTLNQFLCVHNFVRFGYPYIQVTKTNMKQFPKVQLFNLDDLEHTKKGLEKNNLPHVYSKYRRSI